RRFLVNAMLTGAPFFTFNGIAISGRLEQPQIGAILVLAIPLAPSRLMQNTERSELLDKLICRHIRTIELGFNCADRHKGLLEQVIQQALPERDVTHLV